MLIILDLSFAGEVLTHFFGLHTSRHQWMIDIVEKDKAEEVYQNLIYEQKQDVKRKRRDKKDAVAANTLETGN